MKNFLKGFTYNAISDIIILVGFLKEVIIMNMDILKPLLQAEEDYCKTVGDAVLKAEDYIDSCRKEQTKFFDKLNQEYHIFEETENEKLKRMLDEDGRKAEIRLAETKESLRDSQQRVFKEISERFKREVLNSVNG